MNDDHVDPAEAGDDDDVASLAEHAYDPGEVDRDEDLLAALGAGDRPGGSGSGADAGSGSDSDSALLALLADWRAELDAAPLPALPDDDEIAVALAPNVSRGAFDRDRSRSGGRYGKRPALWQALTGAAAVAAVVVGGLSVAAHSAMPGDPLWDVSKTIFSDRAGDVQLVNDLSEYLTAADLAARDGDRDEAERLLGQVSERLDEVGDAGERVELMKRRDAIQRGLSRITPSAVPSPAPEAPEPEEPEPGPATLVPGAPGPQVPPHLMPPPPAPGQPVIPLPLDGINIPTTLQIPVDTQRLQDFLSPTTGQQAPEDSVDRSVLQAPSSTRSPSRTTVTQVPTSTQSSPTASEVPTSPTN